MNRITQVLFVIMVMLVIVIVFIASQYLNFEVRNVLLDKGDLVNNKIYRVGFYGHIMLGMVAIVLGPSQFIPKLRASHKTLHRFMGSGYVFFCIVSGIAGLCIAQYASGGLIPRLGFTGLAISWLVTTSQAYIQARKRNIPSHQIWMFRSYAVTLAAVTLRLYLGPMMAMGVDFYEAYKFVSFACWIPNLILVELIWIRKLKMKTVII